MCRFQRKGAHRLKNGGAHPKGCAPHPNPANDSGVRSLAAKPQKGWINMEWIKRIARRILREEMEAVHNSAVIRGYEACEKEVLEERHLARPEAVAAWNAAVEAGGEARSLARRRSSRNRLRATA